MNTLLAAPIAHVILTQLYWVSFLFIGYVILHATLSCIKNKKILTSWNSVPGFAKLSVFFASACTLFAIFTVIGYIWKLPSSWLSISYLGTFFVVSVLSVIYIVKNKEVPQDVKKSIKILKNVRLFSLSTILFTVIICGYIIAIVLGSFTNGDALVHLSKIRHLTSDGFTFTDMYFGTVPETRYTVSLLHTLIAIPSYIGIGDIISWLYAMAPLKLMFISAIFYLSWHMFGLMKFTSKQRMTFAAFSTTVAVISMLFGPVLFTYPNHMVMIWITLFVIGFIELFKTKNPYLLLVSSVLITFTHPLTSVAVVILLGLVTLAMVLFNLRQVTWTNIMTIIVSGVILLIMPIVTYFQPNRMSKEAYNYGIGTFDMTTLNGQQIFIPDLQELTGTYGQPVIFTILSAVGIIYLILGVRDRATKILLSCMALYVTILLYNPVAMHFLEKIFPYWSIMRFPVVNILTCISVGVGIIAIISLLNTLIKKYDLKKEWVLVLVAVVVLCVVFKPFGPDKQLVFFSEKTFDQQIKKRNSTLNVLNNLSEISSYATNNSTILTSKGKSFAIPAVSPHYIVATFPGNATPAADTSKRIPCAKEMLSTKDRSLMKQAGVDYLLIAKRERKLKTIKKHPDKFHLVKRLDDLYLFSVDYSNVKVSNSNICNFNER